MATHVLSAATPRPAALRLPLRLPRDPRGYQIAVLSGLLAWGLFRLGFDLAAPQVVVTLGVALATQLACTRIARLPAFDPKSALISGLSLCLLLRVDHLGVAALAASLAIASKFVLRVDGRHVFNPTNFGITVLRALGAPVWVSPGQWGNVAFFAFLMACLGGLVVNRAARSDVTFAFIVFYMSLVFGRSLWLGEPLVIPLHRLQSGALLLFTFFMISDPRTTPNSRAGRILFALLVACGAWYIQFRMFRTNGLLWSLAFFSLTVPLIDRLLPGTRYEWSRPTTGRLTPNGVTHETTDSGSRSGRGLGVVGSDAQRLLRFLRSQS
jgi:Na+-transporting NADH:ubiquinone oxidoreductase subunit NqrB